jgi:hypothetical protein
MNENSAKDYLELIAEKGDLNGYELTAHVPRTHGDYRDFYPLAALLHCGYVQTDSSVHLTNREKLYGALGYTTQDSAASLCQFSLPAGASFEIEGVVYNAYGKDFAVNFFLTGSGYLELGKLREREQEQGRRKSDHWIALAIAVGAAILSAAATSMLS